MGMGLVMVSYERKVGAVTHLIFSFLPFERMAFCI